MYKSRKKINLKFYLGLKLGLLLRARLKLWIRSLNLDSPSDASLGGLGLEGALGGLGLEGAALGGLGLEAGAPRADPRSPKYRHILEELLDSLYSTIKNFLGKSSITIHYWIID